MSVVVAAGTASLQKAAIHRGVEEARRRGLPLVLTAHFDLPRRQHAPEVVQQRRDDAEAVLRKQLAELEAEGVPCAAYMPQAPTPLSEAILQAAAEHDAQLIVVGVRRRTAVGKALLGSSAQDILLRADVPVLAVKLTPEEEDAL